jgi:hypothetical protein
MMEERGSFLGGASRLFGKEEAVTFASLSCFSLLGGVLGLLEALNKGMRHDEPGLGEAAKGLRKKGLVAFFLR